MKKTIRFAQYGCGRMGKITAKYAWGSGCRLVAAFNRSAESIGKDADEVFGIENSGVKISGIDEAEKILAETKPDICIITTQSLMKEVKDIMAICARNGINAITTCEEALYPWNSSPVITEELDKLAKENRCTLTGTGANEAQYGGIFGLYGGITHKTDKIEAKAIYNVDDYGVALAKGHGVGLSKEEFEREISAADKITDEERESLIRNGEFLPSYVWNANGWICDYLGLTVTKQTQRCEPQFADIDIRSETLGEVIPAGNAIGMAAIATTQTEEGIVIETQCVGILYGQGEMDSNESISYGVPDTQCVFNEPDTVGMTCAVVVNRIPDVINAEPGFVATSRMPVLKYRVRPLDEYLK